MSTIVLTKPVTTEKLFNREEKPLKLARTSSLDKIRMFNSYVYSHPLCIITAILNWLKTSQSGLQHAIERTIFIFRYLFFSFVYKLTKNKYVVQDFLEHTKTRIVFHTRTILQESLDSILLLRLIIYGAVIFIMSELALCIYLLCASRLPSGLVFLVTCVFGINFLFYKSNGHKSDRITKSKEL